MTLQNQIDAAIAKAIHRAPFTYFDQLIILHQGELCIIEEDDISVRWIDASDTVLHRIAGELSDEIGDGLADELYDGQDLADWMTGPDELATWH